MAILPGGALAVCDAYRGLLRVNPGTGEVELLTDRVDGEPMPVLQERRRRRRWHGLLHRRVAPVRPARVEGGASRALGYRPAAVPPPGRLNGGAARRLQFATGVALTPDGQAVVVAETGNFQLIKYWLAGRGRDQRGVRRAAPRLRLGCRARQRQPTLGGHGQPAPLGLDLLAERSPWYRKALWAMPHVEVSGHVQRKSSPP